jgi:hypothetical protein
MQFFSEDLKNALLDYFQLQDATEVKKEQFIASVSELASKIAMNTILESLSDEKCVIFLRLSEAGEDTRALDFARLQIPDLDQKITQEITESLTDLNK